MFLLFFFGYKRFQVPFYEGWRLEHLWTIQGLFLLIKQWRTERWEKWCRCGNRTGLFRFINHYATRILSPQQHNICSTSWLKNPDRFVYGYVLAIIRRSNILSDVDSYMVWRISVFHISVCLLKVLALLSLDSCSFVLFFSFSGSKNSFERLCKKADPPDNWNKDSVDI